MNIRNHAENLLRAHLPGRLSDLAAVGREGERGVWLAGATALGVGAAVGRFFLALDDKGPRLAESVAGRLFEVDVTAAALAVALGLLAALCTFFGTLGACRTDTGGKAVLLVFASTVVPPTLLCLPTIIGAFFSAPAGLFAFVSVSPFVLVARRLAAGGRDVGRDRERLVGAAFLAYASALLVAFEVEVGGAPFPFAFVPVWLTCSVGSALAASTFGRDVFRRVTIVGAQRGWIPKHVAHPATEPDAAHGTYVIERVELVGAGPHRAAETRSAVARVELHGIQTVLAGVLLVLSVLGPVAWTLVASLA